MMAQGSDDLERALFKRSSELKSGEIRLKVKDEDGSVVKMKYKKSLSRSKSLSSIIKRWTSGRKKNSTVSAPNEGLIEENSKESRTYMSLRNPGEDSANAASECSIMPPIYSSRTLPPIPKTDTSQTYAHDVRRDGQQACHTLPSLHKDDTAVVTDQYIDASVFADKSACRTSPPFIPKPDSSETSEIYAVDNVKRDDQLSCRTLPSLPKYDASAVADKPACRTPPSLPKDATSETLECEIYEEYLDMPTIDRLSAKSTVSKYKYGTTTNNQEPATYKSPDVPRRLTQPSPTKDFIPDTNGWDDKGWDDVESNDIQMEAEDDIYDDMSEVYEHPELEYDYTTYIDPEEDCLYTLRSDDDEVTSRNDDDVTFALLPNTSEASNIEPSSLLSVDLYGTDMPPVDPFSAMSLTSKASEWSDVIQEKPHVVKSKCSSSDNSKGEDIIKGHEYTQTTGLSKGDTLIDTLSINQQDLAQIANPVEDVKKDVICMGVEEWNNIFKQYAAPLDTQLRRAKNDPGNEQPANVHTTLDDIDEEEVDDRKHRLLDFYGSLRSDNHPCAPTSDLAYTDANAHTDDHGMKSFDGSVCSDRENSDAADMEFDRVAYLMNLCSDIANKTGNYCMMSSSSPDADYENTKTEDSTDGGKSPLRSDISQ